MNFTLTLQLNIFRRLFTPALNIEQSTSRSSLAWPLELSQKPDQELLAYLDGAAPEKKKIVIEILYDRHDEQLSGFIRSKVSRDDIAKDIAVEVWIEVLRQIDTFEWQEKPIYAWLVGIAKIKCFEHFRESKERNAMLDLDDKPEYYEQIASYLDNTLELDQDTKRHKKSASQNFRQQAELHLAEAIDTLKPKYRQVIELSYYRGLNSTQIGKRLKTNPGTIRQHHKRAKEQIQNYIEQRIT